MVMSVTVTTVSGTAAEVAAIVPVVSVNGTIGSMMCA
jgi:hypothetical protein